MVELVVTLSVCVRLSTAVVYCPSWACLCRTRLARPPLVGARGQRLSPPRAQRRAARHAKTVCILHPLFVCAVRDPAARGRCPRPRAIDLVGGAGRAMDDKQQTDGIGL